MPERYRIAEWDRRYEVDTKGRAWEEGKPKWAGPLKFIRFKCNGPRMGKGYRRMQQLAGKAKTLQVFGLFSRCVDNAGGYDRDERNPWKTAEEIAFENNVPLGQVEAGLAILTDPMVGWVEEELDSESSDAFRKFGPIQENKREDKRREDNTSARAEFENHFWPKVPNKIGKGKAREAYLKARKKTDEATILAGLPAYRAYEAKRSKQADYRPLHPATWLNGERWADETPGQKPRELPTACACGCGKPPTIQRENKWWASSQCYYEATKE